MSKQLTSVDRLICCLKDHLKHGLTIDARVIELYGEHARSCHKNEILDTYIAARTERNLVRSGFSYNLKLERVQKVAQEYFDKTYENHIL
jgi:hypothetical protein